jgi:hypothetical protein
MNWGKATILILVIFVLFISGMSYYMFSSPKDEYDHQYYENGLNFDHDYIREKQVTEDHAAPTIRVGTDSIKFTFPQVIKGEVKFSRPSSDAADVSYPLDSKDPKSLQLAATHLLKGRWQLVFEWKSGNKAYLYQHEIYIK